MRKSFYKGLDVLFRPLMMATEWKDAKPTETSRHLVYTVVFALSLGLIVGAGIVVSFLDLIKPEGKEKS